MVFISKNFNELTTTELYEILKSRAEVFLLEQKIICQDLDDIDYKSRHYFLQENNRVIAYLRVFYNDGDNSAVQMGRVLTLKHGCGFGAELMKKSIADIKKNYKCSKICLHSQKYAAGFYEKFGFKVVSGDFLEEGIVHVSMELELR
ncbi:MAG: GNAT family N-acetyltransferase [Ruminococcaceae bacterium]|nr:GNAT family N-acetyltransferase [Oscillospiraceae bacterium]